ncbi:hypothetical protein ABZP36_015867 [Zizania latifolia]
MMAALVTGCLAAQLSLVSLLLCALTSTAQHTLGGGSSLSVEDRARPFLVSPDGTFSCGFLHVGDNAFSFSVWFTASRNSTAVWMANRDFPVNGRGSRVSFTHDGELALADANGTTVWSSKMGGVSGGRRGLTVSLNDTGNLVIADPSTSNTVWQSFDWPTDTLLPSQQFTRDTKLVAGYYSLNFDNDNVLRLLYYGPDVASLYWPVPSLTIYQAGRTNYNSSRIAVLNNIGVFMSSDQLQAQATDLGAGIKRRLTIEHDGNFRMYSLNESTGGWTETWSALARPCQAHGLCGRNGICKYKTSFQCSCLPGHEMTDRRDWTKGCRPLFSIENCSQGAAPPPPEQFKFVKVPKTDFYGFDVGYNESITFRQCRYLCLENCLCAAFTYRLDGEGKCYQKGRLFNGYTSPKYRVSIYLKVPPYFNVSTPRVVAANAAGLFCRPNDTVVKVSADVYGKGPRNSTKWGYLFVFASVLGVLDLLFIATGWWFLSSKQSIPSAMEAGYRKVMTSQFRRFTYQELKDVTGNFKEELGRGGSGVVYRGVLEGGRVVAVKRLAVDVTRGEPMAGLVIGCPAVHLSLVSLLLYSLASTTAQHTLGGGSSLSVEDRPRPFLVSSDGTFSCGFLQVGNNAFSFSVWFTASRKSTAVWMANRDAPVNDRGSRVSFTSDGELALPDANGTTVWRMGCISGGGRRGPNISLNDSGNLIITDPSTGSFDWPTDTLLPSQPFTKDMKLVAGYYSLKFDYDNVLRLLYDGPEVASLYWPLPDMTIYQTGQANYNSSRIAVLNNTGVFLSSDQLQVPASDLGLGIKRRLTIEQDGNLRMYSLNLSTGGWTETWSALAHPCHAHGICGRNSICRIFRDHVGCSCMPGHEMTDREDWRKGCKPLFSIVNCI